MSKTILIILCLLFASSTAGISLIGIPVIIIWPSKNRQIKQEKNDNLVKSEIINSDLRRPAPAPVPIELSPDLPFTLPEQLYGSRFPVIVLVPPESELAKTHPEFAGKILEIKSRDQLVIHVAAEAARVFAGQGRGTKMKVIRKKGWITGHDITKFTLRPC